MRRCRLCKKKQKDSKVTFFRVPKDERERNLWSKICKIELSAASFICMDHFAPSDLRKGRKIGLMPSAVPLVEATSNLPNSSPSVEDVISNNNIDYPTQLLCTATETNVCTFPSQSELVDDIVMAPISDVWSLPPQSELGHDSMIIAPFCDGSQDDYQQFIIEEYNTMEHDNFPLQDNKKFYKEQETQTDPIIVVDAILDKRGQYEKISSMNAQIKELELKLAQKTAALNKIEAIFTEGQIRKLMSPGEIKWRWEDISGAICLHASGPRAYNHLYSKGFPLPHVSTLQRWCRKIDVSEGILRTAIDFMRHISDLSTDDKICVLSFDEMKVVETFEYDTVRDIVQKPVNYVQVVMARGLRKSWKQPIFFNYDCQMTPEILRNIISTLYSIDFPVVAIVCDNGPSNRKLWRNLGVTPDNPWFPHPTKPEDKVFAFSDAPHLLKLIRNHFIDSGFIINNELLTSRAISDLLKHTSSSDASITFKLSDEHLSVKGPGRQKVKPAVQLFSNTTASALRRCYSIGLDIYKAIETANFVELVNDWFDILNSSLGTFAYPGKEPFGKAIQFQLEKLNEMNRIMSSPILPNKTALEPFQKGILITNKALVMLHTYVAKKFNMEYICTSRLNQDVLEHFFGAIRSKGGLNDHPSPKEFKYRLRKYILARNTELLSGTGNVMCDTTEWLSCESLNNSTTLSAQYVTDSGYDGMNTSMDGTPTSDELGDLEEANFDDIGILQVDALEYISGYVIRKLKLEEYECQESSFTWVDQVSKGNLKKPNTAFVENIKKLELIFHKINGAEISHCPNIQHRLKMCSKDVELPEKVIDFFFKCRIYFRIRDLNKRLKLQKLKQRTMGFKKMLKIKL